MTAYNVTNLNDNGPGSLREALQATGERQVEFSVAGTIRLLEPIEVRPDVEVFGESAPAGGICVADSYIKLLDTNNIKLHHLRMRPGAALGPASNGDAIQMINATNVLLSHCSLSWGIDENLGISTGCSNIRIEDCIISEGLHDSVHTSGPHSMGMLAGGTSTNIAVERCLFIHNNQRNPLIQNGRMDFINNVVYCTGNRAAQFYDEVGLVQVNVIGNYWKYPEPFYEVESIVFYYDFDNKRVFLYMDGNYMPALPDAAQNEMVKLTAAHALESSINEFIVVDPFPMLYTYDNIMTAQAAYEYVLENAGAFPRDSVDKRVTADALNGTGTLINDPSEVGGWPELETIMASQETISLVVDKIVAEFSSDVELFKTWLHRSRLEAEYDTLESRMRKLEAAQDIRNAAYLAERLTLAEQVAAKQEEIDALS